MRGTKLPQSFYKHPDVVHVAKSLIGKLLVTEINGTLTSGWITETEAYCGRNDLACHAAKGRTKRTTVMFDTFGYSYVYLCYGIHHLFNVTTNIAGFADAVLVRAMEPYEGIEMMLVRRNHKKVTQKLCSGPGTLTQCLGITTNLNQLSLNDAAIWIEDHQRNYTDAEITSSVRVGVAYAKQDALKPWRFRAKNSKFVGQQNPKYDH